MLFLKNLFCATENNHAFFSLFLSHLHLSRKVGGVFGFLTRGRCIVVPVSVRHHRCRSVLPAPLARKRTSYDRPLAGHLDAIRKEFHGTVTGNVHVAVFASGPVQSSKGKGLSRDGNSEVRSEIQTVNTHIGNGNESNRRRKKRMELVGLLEQINKMTEIVCF
jgi:hypothetical protein